MKKQTQPLVSVIMPVYNAGKFLAPAIESILRQSYKHFEFIIVDDVSTDGSDKVITRYRKRYPKIIKTILLTKHLNKGGDACANMAFQKSRGQFIARMDADDVAHTDRLAKQVAYMQEHPELLLLGSQARVINREGEVIGNKTVPTTHAEIYEGYCIFHPIIHPSVMFRRKLLPKRSDLYRIKYSANNDLFTFFEFLKLGMFANMPEALLDYRVHGDNDSLTKPKERFYNTLNIRIQAIAGGYVPTVKGILYTLAQTIIISLLPERVIIPLYLYMKGILKLPTFTLPKYKYETSFSGS